MLRFSQFDPRRTLRRPHTCPQFCYTSKHSISSKIGATLSSEHVERRLAAILAADVAGPGFAVLF